MRVNTLNIGIVSTAIFLTFLPTASAAPSWLQPHQRDGDSGPQSYILYERQGYEYGAKHSSKQPFTSKSTVSSSESPSTLAESSGESQSSSIPKYLRVYVPRRH